MLVKIKKWYYVTIQSKVEVKRKEPLLKFKLKVEIRKVASYHNSIYSFKSQETLLKLRLTDKIKKVESTFNSILFFKKKRAFVEDVKFISKF